MHKFSWFFIVLIFALNVRLTAGNPTSVPLHDPVYHFLERMETMGFVQHVFNGIKPFNRRQVADYLKQIARHRQDLTSIDRRRLDDYLLDYRWELDPGRRNALVPKGKNWYSPLSSWQNFKRDFRRFFRRQYPEEQNHVLLWETDSSNFYLDYQQGADYERRNDGVYRSASWQEYQARGTLYRNFGFHFKVSLEGFRGNDETFIQQHPRLKGGYSEKSDYKVHFSDRSVGELAFHSKYFDVRFAQQPISWGYGESGKLILSDNSEPYPYLSISKDWGWFKLIALHGKLQSFPQDTLKDGYIYYPDKWLAAHRLEISLSPRFTMGFNECFIYGERYADWAYLIPFNFYRAVQHKLRDRDNATISVDAEWLVRPGLKAYGTIFLDEFRRKKIGTNWYGNKQAFSAGLWIVDPFRLPNLSLRFEYTAIMPWVYTHKYLINSYTSDYRSIGHWAGPNSEVYYFHLRKDWHARLVSGFKFRQWKHGDNYPNENIGGDILLGHNTLLGTQTTPRDTRKFLEGILHTERLYQFYVHYEIFNGFFLNGAVSFNTVKTGTEQTTYRDVLVGAFLKY